MAPETEARNALIKALQEVYAAETFPVKSGKLHPSLGDKGTIIGVYTDDTRHASRDAQVGDINVTIQFYGAYQKEVNRDATADQTVVEDFAERFRAKLATGSVNPRTPGVWFFNLERTRYPDDPVGQKTRYEMSVRAWGNNTALIES